MTDSSKEDEVSFIEFTETLGKVLRDFFRARREQAEIELRRKKVSDAVTARYAALAQPHIDKEAELRQQLIDMIWPKKAQIVAGKIKAFPTRYGNIEIKRKAVTNSLADKQGALDQARKDRRVLELFELEKSWKPKTSVLKKLMKEDSKFAQRYGRFFSSTGGFDELRVRPNDRFYMKFDKDRLTEESTYLGPEPDVKDESPDA